MNWASIRAARRVLGCAACSETRADSRKACWPVASKRASKPIASSLCPAHRKKLKLSGGCTWHSWKKAKSNRRSPRALNERGVQTDLGRPWTRGTVHQVLTNEKYVGNNVYNRISFKLKKKRVLNPADMWIRANGAFEPIISAESVRGGPEDRS